MDSTNIPQSSLEHLCIELMSSITKQWQVYRKCKRNPDWVENNFTGGISEQIFYTFINKSENNFLLRNVLPFIVDCVTDESITDKIFPLLFSYKHNEVKEQMLISLVHKHLPIHMLKKLCETNRYFESYFELVITIYKDNATSADDVKEAIDFFLKSPFSGMIKELISEMNALSVADFSKKRLLEIYAQLYMNI